jgi:hypothetical protein
MARRGPTKLEQRSQDSVAISLRSWLRTRSDDVATSWAWSPKFESLASFVDNFCTGLLLCHSIAAPWQVVVCAPL